MRLENKVVLVTGATSGIGAAIADTCREQGARVMVHELSPGDSKSDDRVYGDLEDRSIPKLLIQKTIDHYGRLDAIVNNAAFIVRSDIDSTDSSLFDRVMAVNVRAPMLLIKEALPEFSKHGGRVVNIGSMNAYCGAKNLLPYSISKGALMTMTRNLADALGPQGIRVNQINVGWTQSEREDRFMRDAGFPADWAEHQPVEFTPSGRLMSPREVAAAALYLLSDEAQLVNGAVIDLEQYPMIGRNVAKDL